METKDIIENNVKITVFMGEKRFNSPFAVFDMPQHLREGVENQNGGSLFDENDMRYHTSWDWLMPVINRITRLGIEHNDELFLKIGDSFNWININNTYTHVVNYIKCYNENKAI